uniref:Protein BIG1 n=1 Tax=Corethron hystrix TaxID=216773 RepID=A0A7S1FUR0_9STRA|mmetsp:Transcript_33608/g.77534  ORF Transcript_33608/g.77534 Transcript_33608/m.77534 type:complete len:274 (+) Transcript_33608:58-879(+)|eukprot:CAMPEP_0113299994 /NCGR_PEP_ID=MMETSP0010_2-20120614/1806_1 /TAXON_ID=216773 ORGANISM="Corethron hystrix, Strain 308" /NCGR_SAMPLE_ID=MMETSP0010_2 /ASSEMBLY_ACC=CAM_ASM_000155 /LENGTH=273 /DNA_ID=CAMNT_0000153339 /DNA_START=37 /DNA_END=858 /DNA_ORIENTATION=- /assembly_acc=CAM_ASM_000155
MIRTIVFLGITAAASAAPAFIFNAANNDQIYKSSAVNARSLIESIETPTEGTRNVVFLLSRTEDGAEGLSTLSSAKKLSKIETSPYSLYPHVSGIDSATTIMRAVDETSGQKGSASLSSLRDLSSVLDSSVDARKFKSTIVVKIDNADADKVDEIVTTVAARDDVSTVALTSLRSISEVKAHRAESIKRKVPASRNSGQRKQSRRLEEDGDDAYGGSLYDPEVYFVHSTPNIFSGILFFLFFAMVTNIGLSCMGMIQGQEVFTNKSPPVGREA